MLVGCWGWPVFEVADVEGWNGCFVGLLGEDEKLLLTNDGSKKAYFL